MPGADPNFLSWTLQEVITYLGAGGIGLGGATFGGGYLLRRRRAETGTGNGGALAVRVGNIESDIKDMKGDLHGVSQDVAYLRGKADQ